MTGTTRVVVLGAGGVGSRHARVLAGLDGVQVSGVADVDQARAVELAAELRCAAQPDLDGLLALRPDAVWLCVPPFAHGAPERAVLAAGLPMFVEKPLAADLPTAAVLAEEVARAGVPTATGYHWRHLDTVAEARRVLAGQPAVAASAWWVGALPPVAWWRRVSGSGGQVVEQATHVLDLLRVLVGEVVAVQAVSARAGVAGPAGDPEWVDDATAAVLRFAGGQVASLQVSCTADRAVRAGLEVNGDQVVVDLAETALRVLQGGHPVEERTPVVDARREVDAAFVAVVRGEPPTDAVVDYAEALRTHALGCAITLAASTGDTVDPRQLLARARAGVLR